MEQLRSILLWTLAISVAVIIAGLATGSLSIRVKPIVSRAAVMMHALPTGPTARASTTARAV